jgi:Transposase IS4
MDNYLTLPTVLTESRQQNVAVIGTARNRRGWLPAEYKKIDDERFNLWYVWHHDDNYLNCRWVDNNVVNMVTTLHTGDKTIVRQRRRPRPTQTNRRNIEGVWGTNAVTSINIPCVMMITTIGCLVWIKQTNLLPITEATCAAGEYGCLL